MIDNKIEIQGYYGVSRSTPTWIFAVEVEDGFWYVVDGSTNVNFTYDNVFIDGLNVESVSDVDTFEADQPINDIDELEREVNDYYEGGE